MADREVPEEIVGKAGLECVRPRIAIERFPPGAAILVDQSQIIERIRPMRIQSQRLTVVRDGRFGVRRVRLLDARYVQTRRT
jgi:hypothetical protein